MWQTFAQFLSEKMYCNKKATASIYPLLVRNQFVSRRSQNIIPCVYCAGPMLLLIFAPGCTKRPTGWITLGTAASSPKEGFIPNHLLFAVNLQPTRTNTAVHCHNLDELPLWDTKTTFQLDSAVVWCHYLLQIKHQYLSSHHNSLSTPSCHGNSCSGQNTDNAQVPIPEIMFDRCNV